MKKDEYYSLLREYQQIISQREYNPHFYDSRRLREITEKLSNELHRMERELQIDITERERRDMSTLSLEKSRDQVCKLMSLINNEQAIEEKDFQDTFRSSHTLGTLFCLLASILLFILVYHYCFPV